MNKDVLLEARMTITLLLLNVTTSMEWVVASQKMDVWQVAANYYMGRRWND